LFSKERVLDNFAISTMNKSIVVVLVFVVCGIFATGYRLEKDGTLSNTAITQTGSNDFSDTITVSAGEAGTFDANVKAFVYLDITHPNVQDLEITLTDNSGLTKTILQNGRDPQCHGENILATFSDLAVIHSDWVLERCDESKIPFYSENLKPVESFSPSSGSNQGLWTLTINDHSFNCAPGTLNEWIIIFAYDIDNDSVANCADNCPTTYNPTVGTTGFQADENQDGVGNECECDKENYREASAGKRKICLKLDNWGFNKRFFKGERKNPGDWAEAIVKTKAFSTFQPGDYSYTNTWLDCHCNELEILP